MAATGVVVIAIGLLADVAMRVRQWRGPGGGRSASTRQPGEPHHGQGGQFLVAIIATSFRARKIRRRCCRVCYNRQMANEDDPKPLGGKDALSRKGSGTIGVIAQLRAELDELNSQAGRVRASNGIASASRVSPSWRAS